MAMLMPMRQPGCHHVTQPSLEPSTVLHASYLFGRSSAEVAEREVHKMLHKRTPKLQVMRAS